MDVHSWIIRFVGMMIFSCMYIFILYRDRPKECIYKLAAFWFIYSLYYATFHPQC